MHAESFWVEDASGQTAGWFYFRNDPLVAKTAGALLKVKARRMAVNFAKLLVLLGKTWGSPRKPPVGSAHRAVPMTSIAHCQRSAGHSGT